MYFVWFCDAKIDNYLILCNKNREKSKYLSVIYIQFKQFNNFLAMQETAKQRLTAFIEEKGLSKKKFEDKCGLSNGYINSLRNAPSYDKAMKMAEAFPELNLMWLLTGEGAMVADVDKKAAPPRKDRLVAAFRHLKRNGYVDTQEDFAKAIGKSRSCVSAAMNGNESYLTDGLLDAVVKAYPIFNISYLTDGRGELLVNNDSEIGESGIVGNLIGTINRLLEQNKELIQQNKELVEAIKNR